jgi:hypothetical protein
VINTFEALDHVTLNKAIKSGPLSNFSHESGHSTLSPEAVGPKMTYPFSQSGPLCFIIFARKTKKNLLLGSVIGLVWPGLLALGKKYRFIGENR